MRVPGRTFVRRLARRLPFLAALGLIAAALGDAALEALGNANAFGPTYLDTDQLGVAPALVLGIMVVVAAALTIACKAGGADPGIRRARMLALVRRLHRTGDQSDAGIVFALALGGAAGIEIFERLVAGGSLAHGISWLAAPPAFALPAYALVSVAVRRVARLILMTLAALFGAVFAAALVLLAIGRRGVRDASFVLRRANVGPAYTQSPLVRHAGGRAPPHRSD